MSFTETAEKAIAAYGGRELWLKAETLEVELSAKGLAFVMKRRPFFNRVKMTESVHRPFSRLIPIGNDPGVAGVLDGHDVRIEDVNGKVIAERKTAREYFRIGRRLFWWDDLDMSYFANYASWNYFTLPALLMCGEIQWRELEPGLLEARFPDTVPTHSEIQRFRFDRDSGLLLQHDYTADIISPLARASNVVLRHSRNGEGLLYPSERRVTPRGHGGKPLKGPVLIHLDIHDYRLM
jgi:diadenosine tetraphosphatase ApaH/serine/threonine PP2A family protein phosphatase